MVDRIGELLNALTEDARKAALAKCKEHNFDPDKGDIPLQESFINLTAACATLKESVDQKKLIQLPLTVQKIFASHLETIQRFQTELINGADQVVNLGNAIEALHFNIWQYGLPQLSGEVLGFQTKMNQLKRLDVEVVKIKDKLESGLELKSALQELQEKSSEHTAALQKLVTDSIETAKKVGDNLSATTEASQKAAAILATIQQSDATSSQLSAATQASNATTLALEQKIKEFYKQIDEYREKINLTTDDAENVTRKNTADTTELISNLTNLEGQIKTQIQKATGFSLFHSFQTRQDSLVKSKRLWIYAILGLVAISVGITLWIIQTVPEGTALTGLGGAFYLKPPCANMT